MVRNLNIFGRRKNNKEICRRCNMRNWWLSSRISSIIFFSTPLYIQYIIYSSVSVCLSYSGDGAKESSQCAGSIKSAAARRTVTGHPPLILCRNLVQVVKLERDQQVVTIFFPLLLLLLVIYRPCAM